MKIIKTIVSAFAGVIIGTFLGFIISAMFSLFIFIALLPFVEMKIIEHFDLPTFQIHCFLIGNTLGQVIGLIIGGRYGWKYWD